AASRCRSPLAVNGDRCYAIPVMPPESATDEATPDANDRMTQSAREKKQAERRGRVIEAAMVLARDGGYDAVHMRDVSAKADVAMGTIYRYFSSKDELLAASLVTWIKILRNRLSERPVRGDTPAERLADTLVAATKVSD